MEPEGSLPHSQQPATCPYPEPDQSIPNTGSYLLKIHSIIITYTYFKVFPVASFRQFAPATPCIYIPSWEPYTNESQFASIYG
jgi:hypothetical protein